jgi:hypothetical protein
VVPFFSSRSRIWMSSSCSVGSFSSLSSLTPALAAWRSLKWFIGNTNTK